MTVPFGPDEVDVIVVQAPTQVPVITLQIPGVQGPPGVFAMGPVTTGAAGTNAFADVIEDNGIQYVSLTIPRGATGATPNITIGTVTTGAAGSSASASITGATPSLTLNFSIPQGAQGIQGIQGTTGPAGPAGPTGAAGAGITIAGEAATYAALPSTLTSGDAGKAYIVTADGKLYIWSGTAFPANGSGTVFVGPAGPANTLAMGAVSTGAAGSAASGTITGTAPNQTLALTIPRGDTGATGATGPANTLTIGTVTTGSAGSSASATITGSAPNQTLNLTIPTGATGATGASGTNGTNGTNGVGVLVHGATDSVPGGTPANTVIYRPAVKTSTYFWGSGTSFPTSGLAAGDSYYHSGLGCLMEYTGSAWRQVDIPTVSNAAGRTAISTSYSAVLHNGFRVFQADTFIEWYYAGATTGWVAIHTVTEIISRFGASYSALTAPPKIAMGKFNFVFSAISYCVVNMAFAEAGFTELPQLFLTVGGENSNAIFVGYDSLTTTTAFAVARANTNITATAECSFLAIGR